MLLGDLYKNMAQLYPGFPYSLTTGASNVDLLPLRHLQCQGAPAKPTHPPTHYSTSHNGYRQYVQTSNSLISVALQISPIHIIQLGNLFSCVNTMYILELTEFTSQYETRCVIYIKNICLHGVTSLCTTY